MRHRFFHFKKPTFLDRITFMTACTIAFTIFNFTLANRQFSQVFLQYAEAQTRKISTLAVNKAVSKQVLYGLGEDDLMKLETNPLGEVIGVNFDAYQINQLSTQTSNIVQLNLKSIEQGQIDKVEYSDLGIDVPSDLLRKGIVYEIPFGLYSNNVLLNNLGPKIPVKFQLLGDVTSNVSSKVTQYGINNALIQVIVTIEIHMQVVIPLTSSISTVVCEVPLAIKVIQGKIPEYYFGSHTIDESIIIPKA